MTLFGVALALVSAISAQHARTPLKIDASALKVPAPPLLFVFELDGNAPMPAAAPPLGPPGPPPPKTGAR